MVRPSPQKRHPNQTYNVSRYRPTVKTSIDQKATGGTILIDQKATGGTILNQKATGGTILSQKTEHTNIGDLTSKLSCRAIIAAAKSRSRTVCRANSGGIKTPSIRVVDVELPPLVWSAAKRFKIPIVPTKHQPRSMDFYVNNKKFTCTANLCFDTTGSTTAPGTPGTPRISHEEPTPVPLRKSASAAQSTGNTNLPPTDLAVADRDFDLDSVCSELVGLDSRPVSRAQSPEGGNSGRGARLGFGNDLPPPGGRFGLFVSHTS